MRNLSILVGVAALAITAPSLAQPGKGNGGGNKGGGAAKVERGGGGGPKANRGGGGGQRAERGGGGQRAERGNAGKRAERGGGGGQKLAVQQRGPDREARGGGPKQRKADRGPAKVREVRRQEQRGNTGRIRVSEDRGRNAVDRRIVDREGERRIVRRDDRDYRGGNLLLDRRGDYIASPAFRTTGLIDGCPPGLAAKNNGCLPPGQAKKLVGAAAPAFLGSALLPPLYRSWYPDNDDYYYRTRDDYVYRIDRDRNYVDAYWPLADDWNGAYYVGAAYPDEYLGYYNVPVQYRPWYADSDEHYYRYGDGAIYQVDRGDGVIEAIVSLLAGGFGVGQPLPAGYDVYNVPYAYRDRYVDTPDNWYRYNDGYIYEVDPTTRIVQAIVETLV
ncbi:hypothetical protein [Sphingomonas sp. LHG3406-1]|uniref:hypothetical protein n=1 Tax=Sphingomonas sp. LHG3406-1 TaxID=2804617 RepID=UPI0026111F85|nr:hypothetical protein [Sphingomonas sp. LHG3406-1]